MNRLSDMGLEGGGAEYTFYHFENPPQHEL